MFYLIIIAITVFIFNLGLNAKFSSDSNKKPILLVFIVLALLIPTFVAGFRDLSVGTDTRGYLLADYNLSVNFDKLSEVIKLSNEELGFISLVFFVTKIFGNFHILMFVIEFIIMFFVIKFALKSETKQEAFFIMLIYMLLCFGESLCIMRQHISFAILLYSTRLLKEKKYIWMFLCFIVAYLFHSSSICFILIYYLLYIRDKYSINNFKKKIFLIFIILSIGLLNIEGVLNIFINVLHVLPDRYNLYISSPWFYSVSGNSIFTMRFFLNVLFIIVVFIGYSFEEDDQKKKNNLLSLILMLINMILYIKSRQFLILSRFSIYFFYGSLLLNPLIINQLKIKENIKISKKGYFRSSLSFVLLVLLLITFYGVVVFNNNNYNLLPYSVSL